MNTSYTTPPSAAEIRVKPGDSASWVRFYQPINLAGLERVASLALGFGLLYALGRRLWFVGGVAALALVLLYRGVSGFCPVCAEVSKWQARNSLASGPDAQRDAGDEMEEDLGRELRRERQRDKIDQRSWESFPASDP